MLLRLQNHPPHPLHFQIPPKVITFFFGKKKQLINQSLNGSISKHIHTFLTKQPCYLQCLAEKDTLNVSREFNLTVRTNSFTEIRSKIQQSQLQDQLHHLLNPNRKRVEEALLNCCNTKSTSAHTFLVSKYFDHTETASQLCLHLLTRAYLARATYAPLLNLPQPHSDRAFPLFLDFDSHENPIPNSHTLTDIRAALSELNRCRLRRSRSSFRLFRCGAWGYRRELEVSVRRIDDAAARFAYVLSNDLGTIDRLVARLCAAVEGDRALVRLGLERGREGFSMQQVLVQLCKSYESLACQIEDLEEHVCLCFYTVNKARTLLLQQMCSNPLTL